jgi:hypothetical protein
MVHVLSSFSSKSENRIRKNVSISKVKDTKDRQKDRLRVSKVFYQSEGRRRRRRSLAVRLW